MNFQKILRSLTIGLIFLIPIFPLLVANSFFFPFITGKAFYFRILVEIAFAAWVLLACMDARYRPKFTPLTIGVTIFATVTLIADLLGVNVLRSIFSNFERMEGWLTIAHLWGFYMVSTHVLGADHDRNWHRWFNTSLGVAGIIAIYGFMQLFGWAAIHQGSVRLDASLGNAAYMAVYMLIHVGIAVYLFFATRRIDRKNVFIQWVYAITAVLFSFLVFETQTRGTILGLIGGVLLSLALYAIFGKKEPKVARVISAGFIGLIVILGVVFLFNRDASFIQNNQTLNRLASISWNENKTQARGYVWPMAVQGALERPIFGWGQENFNYIFNAKYEPRMWSQEQWFDRAHSVFLDWLVASGFVGLLAYLALYVLCLMAIWKSALSIREKSVCTGLIAGYAVHNIFVFDNLASYVLFFALLGFAGSLSLGKVTTKARKTFSTDAIEYVIAPIVLVALVAGLYFINVRPIQANTRLIAALQACSGPDADVQLFVHALKVQSYTANQEIREQILSCALNVIGGQYPGPIKQEFYSLAQNEIQAQIAAAPNDARMYVLGGSFFNSIGQVNEALPILEKAHELTPAKQSVAFQLANVYLNTGKSDQALALLKQAYESDPTYMEARSAYITGLIIAGKDAEATTMFATTPEVFENEQIARAYMVKKQYAKAIVLFQKMISKDPANVQTKALLAQAQADAGMKSAAIVTLNSILKDHPELKTQVEAAIQQLQTGK